MQGGEKMSAALYECREQRGREDERGTLAGGVVSRCEKMGGGGAGGTLAAVEKTSTATLPSVVSRVIEVREEARR